MDDGLLPSLIHLHSSMEKRKEIRNEGMGSEVTKERVGEALVSLPFPFLFFLC